MQHYSKPILLEARLGLRDTVMYTEVNKRSIGVAKDALEKASHKLTLPAKILVEDND